EYLARSGVASGSFQKSSKVFKILGDHFKDMQFEKIAPAMIKVSKDGVDLYQELRTNHPKSFQLHLYIKGSRLLSEFDKLSLVDSLGEIKNLNFAHNQRTWLNKLKEAIEQEMQSLAKEP
ncbi:MAG: hypothetical protein WCF67_22220, partial [Chitinophagaceae bacterium]